MRTRVVLDANIYVSALIKASSNPGRIFRHIIESDKFELVITDDILEEQKRVLFYPKVRKYIHKTDHDILLWLDALMVTAFSPTTRFSYNVIVAADPDDDKYIIAALESGAKYIVSGDKHLLDVKTYEHIKILYVAEFLELL